MVDRQKTDNRGHEETAQCHDALLLKLLKSPPQPRPKRERKFKSKPKNQVPAK